MPNARSVENNSGSTLLHTLSPLPEGSAKMSNSAATLENSRSEVIVFDHGPRFCCRIDSGLITLRPETQGLCLEVQE
jgi:hypothetical protein